MNTTKDIGGRWRPIVVGLVIGLGLVTIGGNATAQTCPSDLSSLAGQIQTPDLQPLLSMTIDQLVANAGGVSQAIDTVQQQIATLSSQQAQLAPDASPATVQFYAESLQITQAALQALQCRQAGS